MKPAARPDRSEAHAGTLPAQARDERHDYGDDPVIAVGDEVLTYRDLLVVGAVTGQLGLFVDELRRGEQLAGTAATVPGELVRSEAAAFRRARHLESRDDLKAWLGARHLVLGDLERYLRRLVARTTHRDGAGEPAGAVDAFELYVELMCSGGWGTLASTAKDLFAAERLADSPSFSADIPATASAPGAGGDKRRTPEALLSAVGIDPSTPDVQRRLDRARRGTYALEALRRSTAASAEAARRAGDHRAEWTVFEFDLLGLATRAAATEAVSCAGDGLSPAGVATRAGVGLRRVRARHVELPAPLAAALEAAPLGEATGPIELDGEFAAIWLSERTRPSADDPEVLAWAAGELLTEALRRAMLGTVRELGPL